MENRIGIFVDERLNGRGIADLAGDDTQAWIVRQGRIWRHYVEGGNGGDFRFLSVSINQFRCRQQGIDQFTADHADTTCDDNFH